jgi:hypothetical protein
MTLQRSPATELRTLLSAYPLPSRWALRDPFLECVTIGDTSIHSVGLLAESDELGDVSGSAGELREYPVARAVFELLERIAVLECRSDPARELPLITEQGRPTGLARTSDLFPTSSPGSEWRYAISSGVALGHSFEDACFRARAELVERDRLLRSWFGGRAPVPVNLTTTSPLPPDLYRLEAYSIPREDQDAPLEVAAVLGFPQRETAPLVLGTAAARTLTAALEGAARECVQRLGFLWGEELPTALPSPEPSPAFHQEFYLCPASHARLRSWLDGEHEQTHRLPRRRRNVAPRFANLTPEHLRSRLWVVKALADDELELAFGSYHPDVDPHLRSLGVHPIA